MDLVGAFYQLPSGNYIMWTFITLIYLKLGLMSYNTQLYRESLPSLQFSSL